MKKKLLVDNCAFYTTVKTGNQMQVKPDKSKVEKKVFLENKLTINKNKTAI